MKIIIGLWVTLAFASPVAAQTALAAADQASTPPAAASSGPPLVLRGFAMITEQRFAAVNTFDAVFGHRMEPFVGGGAQVVFRDGVYVELSVSRFRKVGQRAFRFNGQNFRLGIPLTARLTPVEVAGGYRFAGFARRRVIPFAGGGVGSYSYTETSDFADSSENVDTRHVGYLAVGGVEFRVHRWVGSSVDAQYTHIPGILGVDGISKDAGEDDLGGLAARFKVVIGR